MNELKFLLGTLALWLVCILPGIGLGQLMAKKGIVRDQSVYFSVWTLIVVLAGRFQNEVPDTPWYYYATGSTIAFLGAYRYEYGNFRHWGRRWWLKEAQITGGRKKPLSPWVKGYLILAVLLNIIVLVLAIISFLR